MRLLAHGGTRYSERHRIGAWAAIPREVLESTYGLPGDTMTYGLGILEDCLPFLILRVRQTTDIGRSYAYSLLIDPDREIWDRFGWNAADLLSTILSNPIGATLLAEPERLKHEDLIREFSELRPSAGELISGESPAAQSGEIACWLGSVFSDQPVLVKPESLGFTTRPQPDQLARLLYGVQPCFRAGAGWLIGGSREHGESLGARLVLDDGVDTATQTALQTERGRQVVFAWETISANPEFEDVLSKLAVVPICEWQDIAGQSGSVIVERLHVLAQILRSAELPDELFGNLEPQLQIFPFLANEIQRAAHKHLFSGTGSLSPAQSGLVLRNFYRHGLDIGEAESLRLDRETLTRLVVEYESGNPASSRSLVLPREIAAEVYVRRVGSVPQYRDVPRLFSEAAEFIGRNFGFGARGERWLTNVFEAVEQRTKATTDSLHVWDAFPRDSKLWLTVSEMLKEVARNRAKLRSTEWELEYLCFGKDMGGEHLLRDDITNADASRLVARYLQEVAQNTDLAPVAKEWLHELAFSQLRLRINIADKIAVAQSHFSARWMPFLALWNAYADEPESEGLPPTIVNRIREPAHRELLRAELHQMLVEFPPRAKFPDLRRLQKLLGKVPEEFISELRKPQQRLPSTRSFARWIDSLLVIGERQLAAKEIARYCLGSREPLPVDWLFQNFDEQTLEELADQVLFRGLSADDRFFRSRCEEILGSRNYAPRLRKVFGRAASNGLKERWNIENFVRRYGEHEQALDQVFVCLTQGSRQCVVGYLLSQDDDAFVKTARGILEDVEAGVPLNIYRYSILKYVRTSDSDLKKRVVRWTIHTKAGLDIRLDEILAQGYSENRDDVSEDDSALKSPQLSAPESKAPAASEQSARDRSQESVESAKDTGTKARTGFGGAVRSLWRNVIYEEPPASLTTAESSSSTPPAADEEDDS